MRIPSVILKTLSCEEMQIYCQTKEKKDWQRLQTVTILHSNEIDNKLETQNIIGEKMRDPQLCRSAGDWTQDILIHS